MLLDDPTPDPALGWTEYAGAFAGIVAHSRPQFAVGIFGDWGSGKTTLMRAIWRKLETQPGVVQVWFNAWRYEREEHLIVPMLDTLREALAEWADQRAAGEQATRVRDAAEKIGRAARTLIAGLSVRAKLPLGIVEIGGSWDPASIMAAFEGKQAREDPSSFYHASFNALRTAVSEFQRGGVDRVVVYIDDLDRCLPLSALEVLESMKLFFDLDGFVFVVGLDQQVIERSVELKYQSPGTAVPTNGQGTRAPSTPVDGASYIKKIFQLSLGLPRITTDQIEEFFDKIVGEANLSPAQTANFNQHVRKHLAYLAGDAPVNPREVKRLLNAYTLQLKMLAARGVAPLDPDIVLALQTIGFRRDWQDVYERLTTQPEVAIGELREAVETRGTAGATSSISGELLDYLADAAPAFVRASLNSYISSARTVGEADVSLLEAQTQVARMQRRLASIAPGQEQQKAQGELRSGVSHLLGVLQRRTDRATARDAAAAAQLLETSLKSLDNPKIGAEDLAIWAAEAQKRLDAVDDALRVLRRQTSVRALS